MTTHSTRVLFRPDSFALRFLPEGPYPSGPNQFRWVAIQHGAEAKCGSLNLFDLTTGKSVSYELPGRPGFAFATNRPHTFVIGLERHVRLFNTRSGEWTDVCGPVDTAVDGTIINDALATDEGLIFGCKDVTFSEKKAGLYLWRRSDRRLIQLRGDQICSNGKSLLRDSGRTTLLDIDSPTKTVVAYDLDVAAGRLGEPRIVVDLRDGDVFPDGMILTPDGRSVIVALYNPGDTPTGAARQFSLATGQLEATWTTDLSPRVTCPQLLSHAGRIQLVLTTAVEHMPADQQAKYTPAGSLFIAETDFKSLPAQPVFVCP